MDDVTISSDGKINVIKGAPSCQSGASDAHMT